MNPKDFVAASDAVYLDNTGSIPRGWKLLLPYRETSTGYTGGAFQTPGGEVVIAHAGTKFDRYQPTDMANDWMSNLQFWALKMPPEQWKDAQNFTQEVTQKVKEMGGSDIKIHHTGHSLGGILAQISAYHNGHNATVFESPGVKEILEKGKISSPENYNAQEAIHVYNVNNSLISTRGTQITEVQLIDRGLPEDHPNPVETHFLSNFDNAFNADGSIHKTLHNPEYVKQLLREKWNANEASIQQANSRTGEILGDVKFEERPQIKYSSFEDFHRAYLQENGFKLPAPTPSVVGAGVPSGVNGPNRFAALLDEIGKQIQLLSKNLQVD